MPRPTKITAIYGLMKTNGDAWAAEQAADATAAGPVATVDAAAAGAKAGKVGQVDAAAADAAAAGPVATVDAAAAIAAAAAGRTIKRPLIGGTTI